MYAILNEKNEVIATDDILEAIKKSKKNKIVKQETVNGFLVSTVFLGIDHGLGSEKLWFETMIFTDDEKFESVYCNRCETYKEALEMHEEAKRKVIENER